MSEVKLSIEFTGKNRKNVAENLCVYFKKDKSEVYPDGYGTYSVEDNLERSWSISYSPDINPVSTESGETNDYYLKNVLTTPFLYTDTSDMAMLHDIILILRISGCVANEDCAMHISVKTPDDERMTCLYFAEYTRAQYSQIQQFNVSIANMRKIRLYEFETDGLEFDTCNDILSYIEATYAPVPNRNPLFAQNFALNFMYSTTQGVVEFRAFNSSFDDKYVLSAIGWVEGFIDHCKNVWKNGWLKKHELMRAS